ncbi:MAG: hypothetical protein Q7J55_02765, partial [bacterium]|nr:hypothetical protein [bacterium]
NLGSLDEIEENLGRREVEFKEKINRFLLFMDENKEYTYTANGRMNANMGKFIKKLKSLVKNKDWMKAGEELVKGNFLSKNYFEGFINKLSDERAQFDEIVNCLMENLKSLLSSLTDKELYINMRPIYEIDRI